LEDFSVCQDGYRPNRGGCRELIAIGVDSYVTVEERAVPFQEVTVETILQPIPEVLDIINAAIRWSIVPDQYAIQREHLHFLCFRLGIVGLPRPVESGTPPTVELHEFGWVWDIYPGMISRLNINFRSGAFAEMSFTVQGGYIFFKFYDLNNSTEREEFENLIGPQSYNLQAGVINNCEGVATFHPTGVVSFAHTGTPTTSQQTITIPTTQLTPFQTSKLGMEIQEASVTVDNRLTAIYTFLRSALSDPSARKAIRTYRGVLEGVSTVSGSMTLLVPPPLPHGTINHAIAQQWFYNTTETPLDILLSFFPYAGTGAVSDANLSTTNPLLQIALYSTKFLNVSTNFTPQREITFSCDFRSVDIDVAIKR